jgi:hypothetical protein
MRHSHLGADVDSHSQCRDAATKATIAQLNRLKRCKTDSKTGDGKMLSKC